MDQCLCLDPEVQRIGVSFKMVCLELVTAHGSCFLFEHQCYQCVLLFFFKWPKDEELECVCSIISLFRKLA